MKAADWIWSAKRHAVASALRLLSPRFDGAFSIFLGRSSPADYGPPEAQFLTTDGRRIPVFPRYRYSLKVGWREFRGLQVLDGLQNAGVLTRDEIDYLGKAKGTRTIAVSPRDAADVARVAAARNAGLFLAGSEGPDGLPELKTDRQQLRATVESFRRRHEFMFQQLAAANVFRITPGARILEIGFTTGGHSIFGIEQLGFRAVGIDNYYGGLLGESTKHGHNKLLLGSHAEFVVGDITKTTEFPSGSMDVVFSASVLEHVQDLKAAFAEMYRLVRPGGAIIHNYSPYFCHDGGHALGNGDSPWAHVRLQKTEYLRYLEQLRPHEFESARDWLTNALHYDVPQWKAQRLVSEAGFRIGLWMAKPSPRRWLQDLTPEIVKDCFASMPEIGMEDLVSRSVSFVGIKV